MPLVRQDHYRESAAPAAVLQSQALPSLSIHDEKEQGSGGAGTIIFNFFIAARKIYPD